MGTIQVVECLPLKGALKILGLAAHVQQHGHVEFLVVASVQALHAPVVAFAPQGVATELGPEVGEVFGVELLDPAGVVAAEFFAPVGLDLHPGAEAAPPQPFQAQPQEGYAAVARQAVRVGQKPQAALCFEEGPLIPGQAEPGQVRGALGTEGAFVVDVLGVGLHEAEGLARLPGPVGRIAGLAAFFALQKAIALQDVTDGPWREGFALGAAQPVAEAMRAVAGFAPKPDHEVFDVLGRLGRTTQWSAALLFEAALSLVAPEPLAHRVARAAEAACGRLDAVVPGETDQLTADGHFVVRAADHGIVCDWTHGRLRP